MTSEGDWREGHRIFAARLSRIPESLRETATEQGPALDLDVSSVRSFVTTGVGSSAAHARFTSHLLARCGFPSRFAPLSEVGHPSPCDEENVLVVFSQGLSPNSRVALDAPGRWRRVILATAVRRPLETLEAARVLIRRFAEDDERGTLVRTVGPVCGYWCALELVREIAGAAGRRLPFADVPIERVCARICEVIESAERLVPDFRWLDDDVAFLVSGGYGEIVGNLPLKILEAWLRPMPAVWDLLDVAHGPFQEAIGKRRTFLALTRRGAPAESELLARLREMLDPDLHRIVLLEAALPEPYSIFEHEVMLDGICLRYIEEHRVDQVEWPGRDLDEPLYGVGGQLPAGPLDLMTWPEVEGAVTAGRRTAIVPLGATEQHGPHLPLAVDSRIADALAERLCARIPEAMRLPAIALGCSREHLDFSGTLSLEAETFEAVLRDVLASLRQHGFERALLFTAHGGNVEPLRVALPRLRETSAPLHVHAFLDLSTTTAKLWSVAEKLGVPRAAPGHHAGELETSILLDLEPSQVRRNAIAPGRSERSVEAQALFYPSLRPNAPNGTVGDPTHADPARAERYLTIWTDLLAEAYRTAVATEPKNRQ